MLSVSARLRNCLLYTSYYADIRIAPQADGSIWLRIRDNLTEWMPASMDIQDPSQLVQLDEDGSVNELGIGIIKRLSKSYSYKPVSYTHLAQ